MWRWITGYRRDKTRLTRATAEAHLAGLRAQIAQVRGDLADLQDELALILEDLDGVTRHVARVQQRLTTPPGAAHGNASSPAELSAGRSPTSVSTANARVGRPQDLTPEERAALAPATFTATHRQRTEKETL